MSKAQCALVLTALLALVGCKSTLTYWLRADPVPLTDFVPHHEQLRRMDDSCPFQYYWADLKTIESAGIKHVHIAPIDMRHLQEGNAWDEFAKNITTAEEDLQDLAEYAHKAYYKAFKAQEKSIGVTVVDSPDVPGTLVFETAIVAFAPTKSSVYAAGMVGDFFVPCLGLVSGAISSGSIAVETRVRLGKDGPIVAVLTDTENDPDALISLSKFTWTTPAKINLKRIAIQTATSCTVDKMEDLDRGYPIEFISTFSDADLDDFGEGEESAPAGGAEAAQQVR
ncbi:MAG: DUF3313 domain-containing protein [Kiritimatiellae bacterium]|nr:DUF3313 domain-containing protein [Kiritimatiellia bacterium]